MINQRAYGKLFVLLNNPIAKSTLFIKNFSQKTHLLTTPITSNFYLNERHRAPATHQILA